MDKETTVRIRAFRAIDDYKSSMKFFEGHRKVLDNHGIDKVTSSTMDWAFNPAVFAVLVESLDGAKAYGGARIHAYDGITPLPIQDATGIMDPLIHEAVNDRARKGTGEICGLWNSVEVAGMGIGSYFATIVAISLTTQIGLDSLFALCSPYTVRFSQWVGCRILTTVGNNGTFYYPKLDLLATVLVDDDVTNLPLADPIAREKIFSLRNYPFQTIRDSAPIRKIEFEINYNLIIPGIKEREFKIVNEKEIKEV